MNNNKWCHVGNQAHRRQLQLAIVLVLAGTDLPDVKDLLGPTEEDVVVELDVGHGARRKVEAGRGSRAHEACRGGFASDFPGCQPVIRVLSPWMGGRGDGEGVMGRRKGGAVD